MFTRAHKVDPGFCDVWYWIGVNWINIGNHREGLEELHRSVACKYQVCKLRVLPRLFDISANQNGGYRACHNILGVCSTNDKSSAPDSNEMKQNEKSLHSRTFSTRAAVPCCRAVLPCRAAAVLPPCCRRAAAVLLQRVEAVKSLHSIYNELMKGSDFELSLYADWGRILAGVEKIEEGVTYIQEAAVKSLTLAGKSNHVCKCSL